MSQPLLADASAVYIYDSTLEGLLSAVFVAFANKDNPATITTGHNLQQSLLHSYQYIATDEASALRVAQGVVDKLGAQAYEDIKKVFLSDAADKGGIILRFLQYAMRRGRKACFDLACPVVHDFEQVRNIVSKEAHYMMQFARFAQLEGGVFFSQIDPQASVVPLIMEHFAARFNIQPFIIYDHRHRLAGVFDTNKWWLAPADEATIPQHTYEEDGYQLLWQTFYDTIAIEERTNPACRRNFMPKRFWGNMCEMVPPALRKARPQTTTPSKAAKAAKALPAC
jgi:probable DNA metabolism protein